MKKTTLAVAALIAACAHELNRAYCASLGDTSQPAWADAPQWQKDSALAGVAMHQANPNATPEDSHVSWLAQKTADGWVYGPVKDAAKKEHPCCVPYAELPAEQKAKDYIFRAAVHSIGAALATVQAEAVAAVPTAKAAPLEPGLMGVTYIHRIEQWVDHNYGTGLTFTKGQTRYLPTELALKFLRHQDLFEKHTPESGQPAPAVAATDAAQDDTAESLSSSAKADAQLQAEQHAVMDLHDSVNQMGKDDLAQYAMTHFKQTLDKRQKVDVMRAQLHQYIDQFGV